MDSTFRTAHLVVGALAVLAFLVSGFIMGAHDPPVPTMDWDQRLLFRSRHIYVLCGALVNLALGVRYFLPGHGLRRGASMLGSLLVLAAVILLFFAFFSEPMAGRDPGPLSSGGMFALFIGTSLHVVVNLRRGQARPA